VIHVWAKARTSDVVEINCAQLTNFGFWILDFGFWIDSDHKVTGLEDFRFVPATFAQ
jgi:hypothetical protein